MNVFIVFVKFLGWIIAIWIRLARLIGRRGPKVLERGLTIKMKYIITIKKIGPRGASSPHLVLFLFLTTVCARNEPANQVLLSFEFVHILVPTLYYIYIYDALRAHINHPFKETFYGKLRKLTKSLSIFSIFHKNFPKMFC